MDEQIEMVKSYQSITDRIALKKQINDNLAA
jgi:type I restriction enzyme S subunit